MWQFENVKMETPGKSFIFKSTHFQIFKFKDGLV